jgi:dihydroorotase
VTVLDPDREWVFDRKDSASKSKNNPFFGWQLKGQTVATIVAGKKVYVESAAA